MRPIDADGRFFSLAICHLCSPHARLWCTAGRSRAADTRQQWSTACAAIRASASQMLATGSLRPQPARRQDRRPWNEGPRQRPLPAASSGSHPECLWLCRAMVASGLQRGCLPAGFAVLFMPTPTAAGPKLGFGASPRIYAQTCRFNRSATDFPRLQRLKPPEKKAPQAPFFSQFNAFTGRRTCSRSWRLYAGFPGSFVI